MLQILSETKYTNLHYVHLLWNNGSHSVFQYDMNLQFSQLIESGFKGKQAFILQKTIIFLKQMLEDIEWKIIQRKGGQWPSFQEISFSQTEIQLFVG